MATWNPENILITQKGREVLSKVQAGIGSIQVSRIVSGGGYVSPSQLYRQTAVSSPKQELDIVSKKTDENGSEIVCTGNNSEVEEAYSLYQLGIYVTHQDYTGEVLYLIAQCDTSDPDYIPLPSETPVTLQYSLYMEHSGVSSISITINPSGQLTAGMLDQPGGVPSLTDDGTLEEEVIPESIARQDELESKPSYYYVDNGTDISEVIEEKGKVPFWSVFTSQEGPTTNSCQYIVYPRINEDGEFTGSVFVQAFDLVSHLGYTYSGSYTSISSSRWNVIGAGDFKADGSVAMTGNLNLGNHRITNLASPVDGSDATTKDFVNSSINNIAAFFITKDAQGSPFNTKAELDSTTVFYSGGEVRVPTRNDYCVVIADESKGTVVSGYTSFTTTAQYVNYFVISTGVKTLVTASNKDSLSIVPGSTVAYLDLPTNRYIYNNSFEYQYPVNVSGFTDAQWKAINSGLTSALVSSYNSHIVNTSNPHGVTKTQVGLGNVDNTSDATKKSNFTGSVASGNTGFTTGDQVHSAIEVSGGQIKADVAGSFSATISHSAVWSEAEEYYYLNINVTGMQASYDVIVDYVRSGVTETDNARALAFDSVVFDVKTYNGYIQVRNYSNSFLTVDLPLIIKI